jgi:hypothetical protein
MALLKYLKPTSGAPANLTNQLQLSVNKPAKEQVYDGFLGPFSVLVQHNFCSTSTLVPLYFHPTFQFHSTSTLVPS